MDKHTNVIGSQTPATAAAPETTTMAPTTFVQADTNTFRELVQKLTGAAEDSPEKLPITLPARFSSRSGNITGGDIVGPRRSTFKLQERRQNMRKLEIKLGLTSLHNSSAYSPRQTQTHLVGSPIPSPVTPLGCDPVFSGSFSGSGSSSPSSPATMSEEEKAIALKGFYLHPSPLNTPRGSDSPELLPLFPLHSPKQQQSGDL